MSKRIIKNHINATSCYWDASNPDYGYGLSDDDAISAAITCGLEHGEKLIYYKGELSITTTYVESWPNDKR